MKKNWEIICFLIFAISVAVVGIYKIYDPQTVYHGANIVASGLIILFFTFAYSLAKRREARSASVIGVIFESIFILIALYITFARNDLIFAVTTDPIPTAIFPTLAFVAYLWRNNNSVLKKRAANRNQSIKK